MLFRAWFVLLLLCWILPFGCGNEPKLDEQVLDASTKEAKPETQPGVVLNPVAKVPKYGVVNQPISLDASASTGAFRYKWILGNGETKAGPTVDVVYKKPGRYQIFLQISDKDGNSEQKPYLVSVVYPATFVPNESRTILRIQGGEAERVAVVSPDSHEITLVQRTGETLTVRKRFQTQKNPRTLAQQGDWLWVACQDDNSLQAFSLTSQKSFTVNLGYGARPYGVIATREGVYVTLQAKGQVAQVKFDGSKPPSVVRLFKAVKDARGIAAMPDGRLLITRWRSPADKAVLAVLDPRTGKVDNWSLQFDPQPPSDTEIGGIPNYLNQALISPTGREVAVPSLQANIRDGAARSGTPLRDDTTLRGIVSYLSLKDGKEMFDRRQQFDSRGFLYGGTFSSRGDYLFVMARGGQIIERIDMLTGVTSGTIFQVGQAPEGIVLSKNDRYLYVNAYMSREVVLFDVSSFDKLPLPLSKAKIPTKEPLSPALLLGKQLFNNSADLRLSRENYIACAHCHLEGDSDHLVWDFTQRGEGLRNTISLLGRKGTGDGPIHWSGNFDEIHDFENDIREKFGGKGLMTDEQFQKGTRSQVLGDKKAGASKDLDALAAYVASFQTHRQSPFREADGKLSKAAQRGKAVFESKETKCTSCHSGVRLTDSSFVKPGQPKLHDVGTLKTKSGKRLNQTLVGIDTPTLHGLWDSSPFLHDGSAATLRDVLLTQNKQDKHGKTSHLKQEQISDLIAYLKSLDGKAE